MDVERFNYSKIFRDIRRHVDVGLKFHQARRSQTDARFHEVFESLDHLLTPLQDHQELLSEGCSNYDFINVDGKRVKGNGYRSLLFLLSCLLQPLQAILQKVSKDRGSVFFSAVDHINQLCNYCRALQGMEVLLRNAVYLMESTSASSHELFNDGPPRDNLIRAICSEYLCRDVFYGKLHGFQYAPTMRPLLYMVSVGMASYEKWYNADRGEPVKQLLSSLWKGGKYVQNSTRRGLKLDSLTTDSSVFFVKAFWSLLEQDAMKGAMKVIGQSVDIRQVLEVPAKPIVIEGENGEVELVPPSSDLGYKPVPFVLLSSKWREGQNRSFSSNRTPLPPATGLVIHMHGGGYVAQSPQSHEFYLRRWSNELETPIISIDYTLAPEGPFPRALEECVLVYAWALQNKHKLGTTAERIILVGDSAGGNFSLTLAMKVKQLGLKMPHAILAVYPTTNSTSAACPSRILAVVDPILPLGIMQACQQAYTGEMPDSELNKKRSEYRRKILKAKGFYLPNPDIKGNSPLVSLRRLPSKTKCDPVANGSLSPSRKRSSTNGAAPKRPPLPSQASITKARIERVGSEEDEQDGDKHLPSQASITKARIERVRSEEDEQDGDNVGEKSYKGYKSLLDLEEVKLEEFEEGDPMQGGVANGGDEEHASVLQSLPMTMLQRCDPEEKDKLSQPEVEELIAEVMKAYEAPEITKDPLMSPMLAPPEMITGLPPVHLVGAALDPVVDDSVAMAQKLKSAGQPVTLDIIPGLPHGFLCMVSMGNNSDLNNAHRICLSYLKKELGMSPLLRRGSGRLIG